MLKMIFLSLFLLGARYWATAAIEDKYLEVRVSDARGGQQPNVFLSCEEGCSQAPSDSSGLARLKIPPHLKETDWVTVKVQGWVLISPWNGKLSIPSFTNQPKNVYLVVIAHKGDKDILKSGDAVASLTARIVTQLKRKYEAKQKEEIGRARQEGAEEERKLVLQEVVDSVGLSTKELDEAIRELGRKTQDPYQQGLVALYEMNFPKAEELLTESYKISKAEKEKADAKFADRAFFLGQAFYGQGKYSQAIEKFREVLPLREADSNVLNWLGISLHDAAKYAEAEPLYRRALEIDEKSYGKDHPDVAIDLNNLALLLKATNRLAEAEPLYRRALEIFEKSLGPNHPSTVTILGNYASLLRQMGKKAEADEVKSRFKLQ